MARQKVAGRIQRKSKSICLTDGDFEHPHLVRLLKFLSRSL